jgi:hypothetical protein
MEEVSKGKNDEQAYGKGIFKSKNGKYPYKKGVCKGSGNGGGDQQMEDIKGHM